ncbi:MAG TPA: hypothetical protein VGM03_00840, partial [Phycisphaerae bacterium]
MSPSKSAILAVILVSVIVPAASAEEPMLTFGFSNLDGEFVAGPSGTGNFMATAAAGTSGAVTRIQPAVQTAAFGPGSSNV